MCVILRTSEGMTVGLPIFDQLLLEWNRREAAKHVPPADLVTLQRVRDGLVSKL